MWRSAGSAATVALASGSVAVWVLCSQSRDCGTTAVPKLQAPSLTSGGAASAPPRPTQSPPSVPPTCTCWTSRQPRARAPFSSPPPAAPPLYGPHLPPLSSAPAPPSRSAQARPEARLCPPLPAPPVQARPFLPLRGSPLPASFPPPPLPDWLGPLGLGPRPAPSSPRRHPQRLGSATSALAPGAAGSGLLRGRAWPATRQVLDVYLSVGPQRISSSAAPGWGGPCCRSCRGSSSPRCGGEVSARGRGPGAGGRELADSGAPSSWQVCRHLPPPQRCRVLPPTHCPGTQAGSRARVPVEPGRGGRRGLPLTSKRETELGRARCKS